MGRISYVPMEQMDERMQEEMHRCAREGTPRPESSAVRAHAPNAFWAFADSWKATFHSGVVDHPVKELCRVYISRTVKCEFCGNQRSIKATTAGLLEQQYDDLLNFESSDRFDERQKAALAYAEAIAWKLDVDDKFWDRLHQHFSEPELVELGCFIALTYGQQSWLRLLDIDHHEYLAGTDASMAPGFRTAEELAASKAKADYSGQVVSLLLSEDGPVEYRLASTLDGLYTPYALRRPAGPGPFPFVFLAYGNGGGGLDWLRDRVAHFPYVTERLLAAGYACAWGRYRSEVELGYHSGGPLVRDRRQGMDLFNRSPLEFEDELAVLDDVRTLDGVDPARIGHVGVSHAGEMLFKLASAFPDAVTAGVACEPANHEFLDLNTDATVTVNPGTGLRDIEEMQMHSPDYVRPRINEKLVAERIEPIRTPMLVMGRDGDHLQGIFRVSYDVLAEAGKDAEWVSFDHPLHGYIFPVDDAVDAVQERAVSTVVDYLDKHLG